MAEHQPFAGMAQEETARNSLSLLCIMQKILQKLRIPTGFDLSLNRQRVTAAIESGTITTVTTVTTATTLANFGSYPGNFFAQTQVRNTWGNTVGRRFT